MTDLNHLLRRLTPTTIIAVGASALLVGIALLVFVLLPLTALLLAPLGAPVAAIGGLIVAIGGGVLVGNFIGHQAGKAYYDRLMDDAVHASHERYAETRHSG